MLGRVTKALALILGLGVPLASFASSPSEHALLAPPKQVGPVEVRARLELRDVNQIDDSAETFEFTGVLTLEWRDPRQAFDPGAVGVHEKIFQGAYQFDELATGWYPQVVLANESGLFQKSGTLLRIRPDGSSTLIETVNAVAKTEFEMTRFPFDAHRLEAVFEVPGFGPHEVVLRADAAAVSGGTFRVPGWTVTALGTSIRERPGESPAFVASVDVERGSFYFTRLVILPLVVIVLLSFSVFWMDQSSMGDRMSVSFIGVLTAVAYQLVINDSMPRISYVTFIHGFLSLSFLAMSGTVLVNLVVGVLDRQAKRELGDRIDRRCRWLFPVVYFGLILATFAAAFLVL